MSELDKTYLPLEVEAKWIDRWEHEQPFRAAESGPGPAFSVVIPPPNVTGILHVGHALNDTLQDIIVRWRRMQGRNTLWVPGTDHAGIATQNVVEKQLAAEGSDRHRIGREAFLERVWKWKEESGGTIIRQLKRLGCSCDWSRERFTLDDGLSRAVREVFVRLHGDGLIYRDEKIINWCPRCHTALSDLEVEYEDRAGYLYHVLYPLTDGDGGIVVATTRPETIPGDTAVAVHPEDERFSKMTGRKVRLPVDPAREVPVVTDESVDPAFGTGALKITPAHDAADFEIGRRHDLPAPVVIDKEGFLTEEAGLFAGMERFAAREAIVAAIEQNGCLVKTEEYDVPLGHCYRCRSAVEPALSPQWFVHTAPLAAPAMEAVRNGKTRIIPHQWEKTYFEWMENIRDWCISRQIWWGHQIPAWYCLACNDGLKESMENGNPVIPMAAAPIVSDGKPQVCPACGGVDLVQDPDVLDTWFSSALWPFSTLGWPDEEELVATFYPTSLLVTSFDILFFWVARMMMMGLKFMGDVPFHDVYIHALVRDSEGQKMSKSKGNVIDPLVMMDKYGTDAFRFTLTAMAAQGRDIKLSEERIAGYRNFVTKLWNATRLVSMHVGEEDVATEKRPEALEDRWIRSRLEEVVSAVNGALEAYHYNEAASTLYQFLWHEFCDWYLEIIKPRLAEAGDDGAGARATALQVLIRTLTLVNPLMPFVTEEISELLPGKRDPLYLGPYPRCDESLRDRNAEEDMAFVVEIVSAVRTIRGEMNIKPNLETDLVLRLLPEEKIELVNRHGGVIRRLARLRRLEGDAEGAPGKSAASPLSEGELYIPMEGVIDFTAEAARLEKELAKAEKEIAKYEAKLARKDFVERAPAAVVEKDRRILAECLERRAYLQTGLERVRSWIDER